MVGYGEADGANADEALARAWWATRVGTRREGERRQTRGSSCMRLAVRYLFVTCTCAFDMQISDTCAGACSCCRQQRRAPQYVDMRIGGSYTVILHALPTAECSDTSTVMNRIWRCLQLTSPECRLPSM